MLKNKEKIIKWLEKYNINNYELISDNEYGYVVNVYENVYLNYKNLDSIDVKFNIVDGNFICSHNNLRSLKGCPNTINGLFFVDHNLLTSLEHCPKYIKGNSSFSHNKLKNINFLPEKIMTNYISLMFNQKLKSFQKINDFSLLKIIQEKYSLNQTIILNSNSTNNQNSTIKKIIKI